MWASFFQFNWLVGNIVSKMQVALSLFSIIQPLAIFIMHGQFDSTKIACHKHLILFKGKLVLGWHEECRALWTIHGLYLGGWH